MLHDGGTEKVGIKSRSGKRAGGDANRYVLTWDVR